MHSNATGTAEAKSWKNIYSDISALYHEELNSNNWLIVSSMRLQKSLQKSRYMQLLIVTTMTMMTTVTMLILVITKNNFFFFKMKRTVMTLKRRIHLVTNQVSK
jgi:hypothetical protein